MCSINLQPRSTSQPAVLVRIRQPAFPLISNSGIFVLSLLFQSVQTFLLPLPKTASQLLYPKLKVCSLMLSNQYSLYYFTLSTKISKPKTVSFIAIYFRPWIYCFVTKNSAAKWIPLSLFVTTTSQLPASDSNPMT